MCYPEIELKALLESIFPVIEEGQLLSVDVIQRLKSLPVYIRTQMCHTLNWDNSEYYRKMAGKVLMSKEEEKLLANIAYKSFKHYAKHFEDRVQKRKKRYKNFG
jgi:hypothetical protein